MAFENVDAILDHAGRLDGLELLVRIEFTWPELESGKIASTDQHHAIDRFGSAIEFLVDPQSVKSGQRFAGYAVVAGIDHTLAEVNKPAVLNSA